MCLILEVLRAHLLDNKIDVFCVNNEKPKVEKVQFQLTRGGSKTVNRDREGSTKMQHEIYLFPRFALFLLLFFVYDWIPLTMEIARVMENAYKLDQ